MRAIREALKRIWLIFFVKPEPEKKRRVKRHKTEESAVMGQFTTIKTVLDSLDSVFRDIKKLTPKDSDTQKIVKKFGPYIASLWHTDRPESEWDKEKEDGLDFGQLETSATAYGYPSILINYYDSRWSKHDDMLSDFLVATKAKKIPFFRRKPGTVCYDCVYVFLLPEERLPSELSFHAEINKETREVEIYPSLWRPESGKWRLSYPNMFNDLKRHEESEKRQRLKELFCAHFNMTMKREMGINIIVKKGKNRATITVPPNRWKYFFKHREKIKSASGRMKPIFHAVMSHHRELKNGKISNVKTHYRGLRSFKWNGYTIKIIMPGKHGAAQASFGAETEYVKDEELNNKDMVLVSDAATRLNRAFEGEYHAH